MIPENIDWTKLAEAMQQFERAVVTATRSIAGSMQKFTEAAAEIAVPLIADQGIAELEMDLKLRDEIGLRTDLLSLHDEEP